MSGEASSVARRAGVKTTGVEDGNVVDADIVGGGGWYAVVYY